MKGYMYNFNGVLVVQRVSEGEAHGLMMSTLDFRLSDHARPLIVVVTLCSWARFFTLTVPFLYKWLQANLILRGNPAVGLIASYPGGVNIFLQLNNLTLPHLRVPYLTAVVPYAMETRIISGSIEHLAQHRFYLSCNLNFYLVSLWLAITFTCTFRLKGLTRLEECDSCNQNDSGEERFQQHAAGHFGDCFVQSEQKSEEKATLTKLPHVSPPAPDKKGETKNLSKVHVFFHGKRQVIQGGSFFYVLLLCSKRYSKKI